ncbi:MAG: DNA mismatch repair endonuclease MutL [Myxococcota bacterium]
MAIRVLEEHLVNKIAAGEVVERPASVVRELVENALDAGATELRVHLRAGGRNLVRVVDDGAGMDRTDAMMCLERHATSKIRTDEDLFRVATLGFRGEAIPSIASVSKMEILTRPRDAEEGTRVVVEGGRLRAAEPAGCAPGTEITVGSLFFNVPARRKFLRSVDTELGHCLEAITREALVRPELDLEVTHDERELVRCARVSSRARRAADLLGAHGEALLPVDFERGTLKVRALVSPVGVHRASPQGSTWLYVNGRFVKDLVLRRAVTAAYAGIVPKDRYPLVILEVLVPPADVDVNVHPAKTEVRFQHAWDLQNAVAEGLRAALQEHGIRRPVAVEARYRAPEPAAPVQERLQAAGYGPQVERPADVRPLPLAREPAPRWDALRQAPPSAALPAAGGEGVPDPKPEARSPRPSGGGAAAPEHRLLPVPRFRDLRVIGQLADTYVLCEGGGELVVVDQHAAHERVTLYRLTCDASSALGGAQRLLVPIMVELGPARAKQLDARADVLARYGFEVAAMGGGTFAVLAVPAALRDVDLATLLADVADEVAEGGEASAASARLELYLATKACHTSVRAGQTLSEHEMRALLGALDEVDFSVCAHGRPVAIRVGTGELERRFHRS